MLNSIYYFCSIVAVLVIIRWYVNNDGKSGTSGLLAMKDDPSAEANGSVQSQTIGSDASSRTHGEGSIGRGV